jgi:E3 ubiquitin-protein ligase RGLG
MLASFCKCFFPRAEPTGTKDGKGGSQHQDYRFHTIGDNYRSIEEVQQALRQAGLESSNLIIGVDFTKSNTWTGEKTFHGRCLHDTLGPPNPYQQVIEIVGRTLQAFDDDNMIPTFGFGDAYTTDKSCFPFFPDRPCHGLEEVLSRYGEIAPGEFRT